MEFEIKSISLSSVLKISFLVALTVFTILCFFIYLFVFWFINLLGDTIQDIPLFNVPESFNFSLAGIIFGSILNGLLLSVIIVGVLLLIIIFYNMFSRWIGGIRFVSGDTEGGRAQIEQIPEKQ